MLDTHQLDFTADDVQLMLDNLDRYDEKELAEIDKIVGQLEHNSKTQAAKNDLIAFCQYMQSDYIVGRHHRLLADLLMRIEMPVKADLHASGKKQDMLDRIAVNIPPRHGKSQLVSIYYPAWFLGRNPHKKVLMVSHTTDLAVDFGRKVRNLLQTKAYKEIFSNVSLSHDSKSAGRWTTNHGGEFYACGVGSSLAGRGADLLIIDDPHSEQDVLAGNYAIFEKAYEWFTFGARTRLMPGGRIAIIQTRWHLDDLTGRVVKDMNLNDKADQYEVVEFPAILEIEGPEGEITEKALWPEFFDLEALERTKASMPLFQWNAQYQQNPTAEEGAIIKRDWWRQWLKDKPPKCEYIIMTLDAAAEKHNRADFTAITTWGVFNNEEEKLYNIILLNSIKERMEYPELKILAKEQYDETKPDAFIVEKKSSGVALYQELRRTGILVSEYTPSRGSINNPNTKMARLNSVADMVKQGVCWVPQTRWAEELTDEVAEFPHGSNDDLVDCMIMAFMRFRQGGFIRLPTDEEEAPRMFKRKKAFY